MGGRKSIPYQPTADEKSAALFDVAYEVEQIIALTASWPPQHGLQENAWLEATLIHTRLLLDFFEHSSRSVRRDRENNDVLAADYGFPSTAVAINAAFRDRINKDVAHLSYSRQQRVGSGKTWDLRDLRPLLDRGKEFAEYVNAHWASQLSAEQITRWCELARKLTP